MSSGIKTVLGILGGILLLLVLLALLSGGPFGTSPMMGPGGMMGNQGQGWWPGGMMDGGWGVMALLWMLVPLLFWGGLIAVIVWAVIHVASARHHHDDGGIPGESAEEILRQRFARGEIDAEEYEERRRVLNESRRGEVPK
jgi:putative membrane protein